MGILGGIGRQALNVAGRNFLGVDFEAQKRAEELRALKLAEIERMKMLSAKAAEVFNPIPGQVREIPGQLRDFGVVDDQGGDISAAFGMEQGPSRMVQGPDRRRSPQETAAELARYAGMGVDIKDLLKAAEFAKPKLSNFDGQIADDSTGEILRDVPSVEKNQKRVYDERGNVIGVMDLNGAIRSIADRQEAQTLGTTRGTLREVGVGGGATRLMTGRDFMDGRGGANPELGYTPSPTQMSGDKIVGDATAQATLDLPKLRDQATTTLDVLTKIRNHPSLSARTGNSTLLPALRPEDVDFDVMVKQIGGGAFLEAIASLKNTGQITEIEGAKATDAIARMQNQRQSQAGFINAMNDYERIVKLGLSRAENRAAAGGRSGPATGPRTTMGRSRILSVE